MCSGASAAGADRSDWKTACFFFIKNYNSNLLFGGIAQLGERLHGMQEVNGSIPFTSTKDSRTGFQAFAGNLFFMPLAENWRRICFFCFCQIQYKLFWGYSSAGRALAWHARGQRFDPVYLHQKRSPSSRGLGHDPFTVGTAVRICLGTPVMIQDVLNTVQGRLFRNSDEFLFVYIG